MNSIHKKKAPAFDLLDLSLFKKPSKKIIKFYCKVVNQAFKKWKLSNSLLNSRTIPFNKKIGEIPEINTDVRFIATASTTLVLIESIVLQNL